MANGLLRNGHAQKVLVCSAEGMSNVLDYTDNLSTVFGDGASAILLEAEEAINKTGLLSSSYITNAKYYSLAVGQWRKPKLEREDLCELGIYLNMGAGVTKNMAAFVPNLVPDATKDCLSKIGMQIDDIDFAIFHQTSQAMVNIWATKLRIPKEKYLLAIENVACLSSASVPNTLKIALSEGKIKKGDIILLAGAAVGWSGYAQIWKISNSIIVN